MSIEEICKERDITQLIHFTQASNLNSILEHGLCTRAFLDQNDIQYEYNDDLRIDGFENTISLSVSFPNNRMFYRLRKEEDCNWIVLLCDAQILIDCECIYCFTNAADTRILLENHDRLKTDIALENMFSDEYGDREKLDDSCPSDVQAEVLCLKNIDIEYVKAIVFDDKNEMANFIQIQPGIKAIYHPPGKGVFASREYFIEGLRRSGL